MFKLSIISNFNKFGTNVMNRKIFKISLRINGNDIRRTEYIKETKRN